MARRIEIKVPHLPAIKTLFTVNDTPIGTGKSVTNKRRADVELVQFFAKNPKLFRQLPPTRSGRFLIDGDCGAQTKAGIWVFQTDESKRNSAIYPDGVVDAPSSFLTPSGSKHSYTILALNDWFLDNGTGTEHFSNLENHPDLAGTALRTELTAKAAA
jgi:hypothetical protein